MTPIHAYTIEQLAPGSYDVLLDGIVIASLVRCVGVYAMGGEWQIELLHELPPFKRPDPFVSLTHTFRPLPAALDWLGIHEWGIADAPVE